MDNLMKSATGKLSELKVAASTNLDKVKTAAEKKYSEVKANHPEQVAEVESLSKKLVTAVDFAKSDADKLYANLEAEVPKLEVKVKASEERVSKLKEEAAGNEAVAAHDALLQSYTAAAAAAKEELEKANQAIATYKQKQDVKISEAVKVATLRLEELETETLAQQASFKAEADKLAAEEAKKISDIKAASKTKMEELLADDDKSKTLVGAKKKLSHIHHETMAEMSACKKATAEAYAKLKTDFVKAEAEAKTKADELKKAAAEELAALQKEGAAADEQTVVGALEQSLKEAHAKMAQAEKEVASKLSGGGGGEKK